MYGMYDVCEWFVSGVTGVDWCAIGVQNIKIIKNIHVGTETFFFQSSVDATVQGSNTFPKRIEIHLKGVGWEWTRGVFSGHSPILIFSTKNKIVGVNEVSPDGTTILMVQFPAFTCKIPKE